MDSKISKIKRRFKIEHIVIGILVSLTSDIPKNKIIKTLPIVRTKGNTIKQT